MPNLCGPSIPFFTPDFSGAKTNKMNCYRWILPVSILNMVVLLMIPFEPRTYPRQSNPSCWINWGGNPKEIEFNLSRERSTDNHLEFIRFCMYRTICMNRAQNHNPSYLALIALIILTYVTGHWRNQFWTF